MSMNPGVKYCYLYLNLADFIICLFTKLWCKIATQKLYRKKFEYNTKIMNEFTGKRIVLNRKVGRSKLNNHFLILLAYLLVIYII